MNASLGVVLLVGALFASDAEGPREPSDDVQDAILESLVNEESGDYFKVYCVAVNRGKLRAAATLADRIRSIRPLHDPPAATIAKLRRRLPQVVPASECDASGEEAVHRVTRAKPVLLLVVGPVELPRGTRAMVTVLTSSGILTEAWVLYELSKTSAGWEIVSRKTFMQS